MLDEELITCTLAVLAGARLPNAQLRTWLPTAPVIEQALFAGLIDQFTLVPAGRGSVSATVLAVPVPGALLLVIAVVNPIGLPALTVAASAVSTMFRFGVTTLAASGKATTTSLN